MLFSRRYMICFQNEIPSYLTWRMVLMADGCRLEGYFETSWNSIIMKHGFSNNELLIVFSDNGPLHTPSHLILEICCANLWKYWEGYWEVLLTSQPRPVAGGCPATWRSFYQFVGNRSSGGLFDNVSNASVENCFTVGKTRYQEQFLEFFRCHQRLVDETVTPGFKAKTECSCMCSQEQVSHIRRLH